MKNKYKKTRKSLIAGALLTAGLILPGDIKQSRIV